MLIYNPAQIILKASFLLQYRRLFPGPRTQFVCHWLLILIPIWGVAQNIIAGLACKPLSTLRPSMEGHCIPTMPVWYLTSAMNIFTDFIIFSVPLPSVVKLQIRTKQKWLLGALFSLGFL